MTPAESALWVHLKGRKLDGIRFRHQGSFSPYYIVDFVTHVKKLVIEVDGGYHEQTKEYDQRRTEFLERKGYKVLRFTNEQVLSDIKGVLTEIKLAL